eukprot:GHVS01094194.1.p1 GENE.GHVS01094194.1~~GHVS01094194.1.p1  ORF type:complete len:452 (-),score=112.61 GHVS01094194.1:318-1586(-)
MATPSNLLPPPSPPKQTCRCCLLRRKFCLVLCLILLPLLFVVAAVVLFDFNDGVRFCARRRSVDSSALVWFVLTNNNNSKDITATQRYKAIKITKEQLEQEGGGGVCHVADDVGVWGISGNETTELCLEDIVLYINTRRAGPDGLVGTNDDCLTFEQQLELLEVLLKQFFPQMDGSSSPANPTTTSPNLFGRVLLRLFPSLFGSPVQPYYANSKWHLNHNAGVCGQLKIVYADINEYIMIFGNRFGHGGYAGTFDFDLWDFLLEGTHVTQFVGNFTRSHHTALTHRFPPPPLTTNTNSKTEAPHSSCPPPLLPSPAASLVAVMPRGYQKIYSSPHPDGALLLEYGRGRISTSLWSSVLQPTIFLTNDWRSVYISIQSFGMSVCLNSVVPLLRWVGGVPTEGAAVVEGTVEVEKMPAVQSDEL